MGIRTRLVSVRRENPNGTNRQDIIMNLRNGDEVYLSDAGSEKHPEAIVVRTRDHEICGMLDKDLALSIRQYTDEIEDIYVSVFRVFPDKDGVYQCRVELDVEPESEAGVECREKREGVKPNAFARPYRGGKNKKRADQLSDVSFDSREPKNRKRSGCARFAAVAVAAPALIVFIIFLIANIGDNNEQAPGSLSRASSATKHVSAPMTAARVVTATASPAPTPSNVGLLGDYHVEITGARLGKNYAGDDCIVVKYAWSHSKSDSRMFGASLKEVVYQDGIELKSVFVTTGLDIEANVALLEVRSGVTQEIEKAYVLSSLTSPIEVDVSEYISFRDNKLTATFRIVNGEVVMGEEYNPYNILNTQQ